MAGYVDMRHEAALPNAATTSGNGSASSMNATPSSLASLSAATAAAAAAAANGSGMGGGHTNGASEKKGTMAAAAGSGSSGAARILYEGWLTKKGGVVPSWKRRWFTLINQPPHFSYAKSRESTSIRTVPLTADVRVTDMKPKGTGDRPFQFRVETAQGRSFFLSADTHDEHYRWMSAFKQATWSNDKDAFIFTTAIPIGVSHHSHANGNGHDISDGHHHRRHARASSVDDFGVMASYIPSSSLPPNSYVASPIASSSSRTLLSSPYHGSQRSLLVDDTSTASSSNDAQSPSSSSSSTTVSSSRVVSSATLDRSVSMGPGARAARMTTTSNNNSNSALSSSSSSVSSSASASSSSSRSSSSSSASAVSGIFNASSSITASSSSSSSSPPSSSSYGPSQQTMAHQPPLPHHHGNPSASSSSMISSRPLPPSEERTRELAMERVARRRARAAASGAARELKTFNSGFISLDALIRDQHISVCRQMMAAGGGDGSIPPLRRMGSRDEKDWVMLSTSSNNNNNNSNANTNNSNNSGNKGMIGMDGADDDAMATIVRDRHIDDELRDASWSLQQRRIMAVDAAPVVIHAADERQFVYGYTYQHLHEGWLTKKGNIVPSYKRRWVRLTLSPPQFTYYIKPPNESPDVRPIQIVPITAGVSVAISNATNPPGYHFSIRTHGRVWFMVADTEMERAHWLDGFQRATLAAYPYNVAACALYEDAYAVASLRRTIDHLLADRYIEYNGVPFVSVAIVERARHRLAMLQTKLLAMLDSCGRALSFRRIMEEHKSYLIETSRVCEAQVVRAEVHALIRNFQLMVSEYHRSSILARYEQAQQCMRDADRYAQRVFMSFRLPSTAELDYHRMVISDVFKFRREYNAMKPMIDIAINKKITTNDASHSITSSAVIPLASMG